MASLARRAPLLFRQLFDRESCTYTYLLQDTVSGEGLLIDPVLEHVERDLKLCDELGLKLKWILNTHCHADHCTGSGLIKQQREGAQSAIGIKTGASADRKLAAGEKIEFGSRHLLVRETPGHTEGCLTFVLDDFSKAFTGDTLLIRGCGRTDFQGGSPGTLYDSVQREIFSPFRVLCLSTVERLQERALVSAEGMTYDLHRGAGAR